MDLRCGKGSQNNLAHPYRDSPWKSKIQGEGNNEQHIM